MKRFAVVLTLAAVAAFAVVGAVLAASGGSAGGGYRWIDSNPDPTPTITFDWVEIVGTGTLLPNSSNCDDCVDQDVPIGFAFPFYGQTFTTVTVSSNGVLEFEDTADDWGPSTLPTSDFSGRVILPYYGDWDSRNIGNVYAQTVANYHGQQAFVVEWAGIESYDCDTGNGATWEAILMANGTFRYQYLDTNVADATCDSGAYQTVGVQMGSSGPYVQYSDEQAVITDNLAIEWTPQCIGDANGDGRVNAFDFVIVARALGSQSGGPRWNPAADLNADGRVNALDLMLVIQGLRAGCD